MNMTNMNFNDETPLKDNIKQALSSLPNSDLQEAARTLINTLGYTSERLFELSGNPREFINHFPRFFGKSVQIRKIISFKLPTPPTSSSN